MIIWTGISVTFAVIMLPLAICAFVTKRRTTLQESEQPTASENSSKLNDPENNSTELQEV